MKRASRFQLLSALLLFLGISGCGGNGSMPVPPAPPPPFTSGLYQLFASSNSNAFSLSGSLMQSGSTVSGVMHVSMPLCFSFSADLPVTGTLSNDVNFPVNLSLPLPSGQMLTFNLQHPGGLLSKLTGTFGISGAGCAAPEQGLANGGAVTISGAWQGTLINAQQSVSTIQLNLTQMGPDAHGFFSATGSGTIAGGTCFGTVSVDASTVIVGPKTSFVLNNSQSGTTGKLTLGGSITPGAFGGGNLGGSYTSTQGACSEVGVASMQTG